MLRIDYHMDSDLALLLSGIIPRERRDHFATNNATMKYCMHRWTTLRQKYEPMRAGLQLLHGDISDIGMLIETQYSCEPCIICGKEKHVDGSRISTKICKACASFGFIGNVTKKVALARIAFLFSLANIDSMIHYDEMCVSVVAQSWKIGVTLHLDVDWLVDEDTKVAWIRVSTGKMYNTRPAMIVARVITAVRAICAIGPLVSDHARAEIIRGLLAA